jgi:HD-GYP domain-containing protein (c-di-GMP phosphodiesterase class II)
VTELFGDASRSRQWCGDLVRRLVGDAPQAGVFRLCGPDPGESKLESLTDVSLALVPYDADSSNWVGAVGLDRAHPLDDTDLNAIAAILRLDHARSRRQRAQEQLRETLFGIVRCLSGVIDSKDPFTRGHSESVARIAVRLGREMGLTGSDLSDLYLASLLHDVGKMGIRDEILFKPGPLSSEEFAQVRDHPLAGESLVAQVKPLAHLCPIVRGHHERYDGTGYPDGLAGTAIPLMARILAVADACVAMLSSRPYRPELSAARIEHIFREGAGSQWDPQVVDHFMDCREELYRLVRSASGASAGIDSSVTRFKLPPFRA